MVSLVDLLVINCGLMLIQKRKWVSDICICNNAELQTICKETAPIYCIVLMVIYLDISIIQLRCNKSHTPHIS